MAALTELAAQPQRFPGRYWRIRDSRSVQDIVRRYYTAREPQDSLDPVISDPYLDAFGAGA